MMDPKQDIVGISLRAKWIYGMLKAMRLRKRIFKLLLNDPPRGNKAMRPGRFHSKLLKTERKIEGFQLLTIQKPTASNRHILLLHGGAYVAQASSGHRYLMQKLATDHNFKVSFLDYPLAPENRALKTHAVLYNAYKKLIQTYENDLFYFVGDSAGGGLALSFLQLLRDKNELPADTKSVLLSPWLDVSMTNPDIPEYSEKDVILDLEGLRTCGGLYAGEMDLKDPRVSPIYGTFHDIQKLLVFVSDHELMFPDCLLLRKKMETETGSTIELVIWNKMVHDWVILPISERTQLIHEISKFLSEEDPIQKPAIKKTT